MYHELIPEQYQTARLSDNNHQLALSVATHRVPRVVEIILANYSRLSIPYRAFEPSGDGTTPDFNDPEVIDWGNTIRFGAYEAAVDAIVKDPLAVISLPARWA